MILIVLITINFSLLLFFIYKSRNEIRQLCLEISKETWALLILIFLLSLILRLIFSPHGYLKFDDETSYMQTAKGIIADSSLLGYNRSIGWPFVLAIAFKIFGISTSIAFYTNKILGALIVFNIFFLGLVLTRIEKVALWSAFLFSLLPIHILWSGGAETNAPAVYFVTLASFFCLLYFRQKKDILLWLSLVSISFAVQFRPESYILFVIFLLGILIFKVPIKIDFFFAALLVIVLSLPNLIVNFHTYSNWGWEKMTEFGGSPSERFLSFSNLIYHTKNTGIHFLSYRFHPFIFSVLVVIGIIYFLTIRKKKELLFLVVWLFLYIVSFFIWKNLDCPERMFLNFYPVLTILAGTGLYFIINKISKRYLIIIFVFSIFISFLPYFCYFYNPVYFLEGNLRAKIPELAEKDLPRGSIIIESDPSTLTSTTNLNVISLDKFLNSETYAKDVFKNTNNVIFFDDSRRFRVSLQEMINFKIMKEKYILYPYKSYSADYKGKAINYIFYKIEQKPDE